MSELIEVVEKYLTNTESVSKKDLLSNYVKATEAVSLAKIVAEATRSAYFSKLNESHGPYHPDEDGCDAKCAVRSYNKLVKEQTV